MEEIIEHVYYEIKNSGYEKKLIGGIVVTGGGSNLRHLPQLMEYVTGMDVRVGYPNEHLAGGNPEDVTSPIFSTGVGLVMKGLEFQDELASKGLTVDDWAEGREGTPVAKKETPKAEEEPISEAEEVAREVAEEKSESSPFSSLRNFGKKIEKWMNEGID
jgi:cell division protein FtsA